MYKLIISLLLFSIFISCEKKNDHVKSLPKKDSITIIEIAPDSLITDTIIETNKHRRLKIRDAPKLIPKKTKYGHFEVVYLDYHRNELQRVFVSIDTGNVYNRSMIQSIICEIRTLFDINKGSSISFFSDKKYADYKTALFIDEGHPLPSEESYNWMNDYYLAEYGFGTNEYNTFPGSQKDYYRQKTFKILCEGI